MPKNRRPAHACARCYKRKKRCDNGFPICSECARAGTECIGLDRSSRTEIPRSLVTFLESLVAQLELQQFNIHQNNGQTGDDLPTGGLPDGRGLNSRDFRHSTSPSSNRNHNPIDYNTIYNVARRIAENSLPVASPRGGSHRKLPYYRIFFIGAELPYPLAFKVQRPINIPSKDHGLDFNTLPVEVKDKLIAVYTERILPQYPYFQKHYVLDAYERFRRQTETCRLVSEDEIFIISMIMAITILSSKSKDYNKLVALAESLRRDAIDTLEKGVTFAEPTLKSVQQLLLMIHYGFLLPSSANLWHISGDAMRLALELGLHQEVSSCSGLDLATLEFRRRLFWVLYSMERSIAVTSHRPHAVRDEQIDVALPQAYDDHNPLYLSSGQFSYVRFVDRLQFVILQSEITAINIGKRAIPNAALTYDEWMIDMEQRIQNSRASVVADLADPPKSCDFLTWQSMLLLHMPCAHNPQPSESSIFKCCDAAFRIAEGYWDLTQTDYVEYPWHAVHNAYEAGILILYILSHFSSLIHTRYSTKRVFEIVHQLSSFFILMTKRWPTSHLCGNLFDGLRKSSLSAFLDEGSIDPQIHLEKQRLKDIVFRENADLLYTFEESLPEIRTTYSTTILDFGSPVTSHSFSNEVDDFLYLFNLSEAPTLELGFANEDIDQSMIGSGSGLANIVSSPTTTQAHPTSSAEVQSRLSADLDHLKIALNQLSVCSQCKRRRIKCDMMLPSCHNCAKAHKDCTYLDHALSQETPRKYIHDLHKQVTDLLKANENLRRSWTTSWNESTPSYPPISVRDNSQQTTMAIPILTVCPNSVLCMSGTLFDILDGTIFWGPTSTFARLISQVPLLKAMSPIEGKTQNYASAILDSVSISAHIEPRRDILNTLVQHYYQSIEICYPILGRDLLHQIVDDYCNEPTGRSNTSSMKVTLELVLAISFALLSNQDQRLKLISNIYYSRALENALSEDMFIHPTILSLQRILLLCIYTWLCPESNNIWRVLGHASRICLDIIEMHDFNRTESTLIGTLYRTLYSLETQIAIHFGRPRQLPDGKELFVTSLDHSSTPQDELSMLIYDLARLKSRFHREMIRRAPTTSLNQFGLPFSIEYSWMREYYAEMASWLNHWEAKLESFNLDSSTSLELQGLYTPLMYWGRLKQSEGLLLVIAASESKDNAIISNEEKASIAQHFLQAVLGLYRHTSAEGSTSSSSSSQNFVFPMSWTHQHTMFNAAVSLLQYKNQSPLLRNEAKDLLQACLSVLTVLETKSGCLSTGLSFCLQSIYEQYNL